MGTLQRARSNQALTFPGSNQSLLDMGNQPLTPRVRKAPGTTVKFRPSPQLSLARTYGCHHHLVLQNRVSFEPIPIEKVDVEVNIVHSLAEVTVKQRYRNDTTAPIECTFEFSVGDNAVLSDLTVVVDEKTIRAEVQEKEEAFATYDDAISSGSGAYLLESTDKANRYKLNVGNLPPQKAAEVHFAYVISLTETHEGWLFTIPETLFPKHKSYISSLIGRVDAGEPISAIEVVSAHTGIKTDTSSFLYTLDEPAFGIASEITFAIKLKSLEPTGETTDASPQELTKPTLVIENSLLNAKEAAVFTSALDFRPVFASATPELASDYEFVVIADVGGAMFGPKMAQQITALKLLVHSLPAGCKFNLISASSYFTSRFQTSVVLDEENLNRVLWTIEHMHASGGETRLKAALASVFHRRDYLRNLCVFVLTSVDYESDSRDIFKLIQTNALRNWRTFCIGFGDEVDPELLNGMAFAGRGKAHFVKEDDFVDGILFQQLVSAFAPRVRDIKVQWNVDEDAKAKFIDQAPHRIPITASGASTLVYGLFEVPVPEGVVIPDQPAHSTATDDKKDSQQLKESPAAAPLSAATASSSSHHADGSSSARKSKREHSEGSPATPRKGKKSKAHHDALVAPLPVITLPEGMKLPFKSVKITGIGPDNAPLEWEIQASEAVFRAGRMIRAFAASKVCNSYEDAKSAIMSPEQIKQKIIDVSTRFQVISKHTSYIAVEERRGEATEAAMKNVKIDATNVTDAPVVVLPTTPHVYPHPNRPICIHRPIRPIKHWMPPPPAPVAHRALVQNLAVSMKRESYAPSFASEKEKSKKKSKSDSVYGGGNYGTASSPALDMATSSLGFALRDAEEEILYDDRLDSMLAQAPAQFRLAAPEEKNRSASPRSSVDVRKRKKESLHELAKGSRNQSGDVPSESSSSFSSYTAAPPAPVGRGGVGGSSLSGLGGGPPPPPPGSSASNAAPPMRRSAEDNGESSGSEHEDDHDADEWKDGDRKNAESRDGISGRVLALPAKSAHASRFSDEQMVPNKANLNVKNFAPPAPKPVIKQVALEAPPGWKPTANLNAATMHTNASKLRAIVTAQHADGSWDLNSVAQLLHVDLTHLETANPMKKDDANATAADTSATPKGGKKSGRKGKKDKTGKTEDATKTDDKEVIDESAAKPVDAATTSTTAETTGEPNKTEGDADSTASSTPALPALPALSDLWATIVLLSYLKHNYDAEKEFWTFVALKVAALLARAVPDETARNALLKKGHKYLSSAPGLLQAAP